MSDVERLRKLGELFLAQREAVERADEELASAKAAFRRTEQEDLPDLMTELGVPMFRLEDGTTIERVPDVEASLTEATRAAGLEWLKANQFGGLIKTKVVTEFGRGESETAAQAAQLLADELGLVAEVSEGVHPATLKAFVKEQMAVGSPIPMDTFNVRAFNRAKVKKGKK